MDYVSLKKFFGISLALHVIALSALAAFLQIGKVARSPKLISVGMVYEQKGSRNKDNKSVALPPKEAPRPAREEVVKKKEVPKKEDKLLKTPVQKRREKEVAKEEVVNHFSQPKTEPIPAYPNKSAESEQTSESKISELANLNPPNGATDTKDIAKGLEVAYPDYKINPNPDYPIIARRNGYEGVVLLKVWVLENGEVGDVEVEKSSGYGVLDKSALQAVKDWIFVPGKKNGVPVSSWVMVPIRFELSSG
ncbi:MAG TPA: energy transducer TonB [Thermodesulfobacteriota bacterium]|nr:energy transducer TonB [Thermodesulfobacteriota bacterium]